MLARRAFFVLLFALACAPCWCATIRVKPDGNDSNDGSSWDLAKKTVQASLNAAVSGDAVWVAQGTYVERITLKAGVGLYGGFAGGETDRSQRSWSTNRTILDGNQGGRVVTSPSGATSSTVIDGFVVRNGGGIYCSSSSPTISNNTVVGNHTGRGVECSANSSATIFNNLIIGNIATGIYCVSSQPTISNNTIVANPGAGILCYPASPTISNNVMAFNGSGIQVTGGAPFLRNNCVYGNVFDYSGISPGVGDISVDPLLAGRTYGNMHLQPGSPCINEGWNGAPGLPATDIDGQPRIQGGTVDIGADESDGTIWPPGPYAVVRVTPTGNDMNDGSAWDDAHAKRTVQAAIDAASVFGGEAWIRAGVYSERVILHPFAYLYGGFAGAETARSQRDWSANVTILDGGTGGSVVTCKAGERISAIDGFTIRNGSASKGGGVYCYFASPSIRNNRVVGNSAAYGGGLCAEGGSPIISSSTFIGNSASSGGGGISFWGSTSAAFFNNTVAANTAPAGGGLYCSGPSSATIANSAVAFNSSGLYRQGGSGTPTLRNNALYGNTAYNYSGISPGTGDISLDPLFLDRVGGDYHLTILSPCIGSGDNRYVPAGAVDMDGEPRILPAGGTVDIGADEYSLHPMWLAGEAQKLVADGQEAYLTWRGGVVATAKFDDIPAFYVESPDRSSGLQCRGESLLDPGQCGIIQGTMATIDGERVLTGATVVTESLTTAQVPVPLAASNRDLGGGTCGLQQGVRDFPEPRYSQALNNIGLLVTVWGNVTFAGADYFYVDDGSKLNDDSGHIGVKVSAQGLSIPSSGFVKVIGISSCEKEGTDLVRLIRAVEIVPVP